MPCTTLLIQHCKGIPSNQLAMCCRYSAFSEYSHPKLPACQTACRNTQMRTNCTFCYCKKNPVTSRPAWLSTMPGFLQGKDISHQECTDELHNKGSKGSKVCLLGLGFDCLLLFYLWIETFFLDMFSIIFPKEGEKKNEVTRKDGNISLLRDDSIDELKSIKGYYQSGFPPFVFFLFKLANVGAEFPRHHMLCRSWAFQSNLIIKILQCLIPSENGLKETRDHRENSWLQNTISH